VLGREAFKLAGDPKAFSEHSSDLSPWQPKRLLLNAGGFGRAAAVEPMKTFCESILAE